MRGPALRHALIDLDGTLWDEAPVKRAIADSLTPDARERLPRIAAELKARSGYFTWVEVFREIGRDYLYELERHAERIVPFPGVEPALVELSRSLTLWLITDGARTYTARKLDRLGLEQHFAGVVTSEVLQRMKDSRGYWQRMLDHVGCDVETTVVIGDALDDVRHPSSLGLRCIRIGDGPSEAPLRTRQK